MRLATVAFDPAKMFFVSGMVLLSMLMAAYTPMASISSAQSAIDNSRLQQLKTKATEEINKRLDSFKKTLASLNVSVEVSKSEFNANITKSDNTNPTASPSTVASLVVGESGLNATVNFPGDVKEKVKESLQKIIEQLTAMVEKISSTNSLASMESLADNLDAQFGLSQLTNVQAAVTQAIESLTGVFDNLKATAGGLQSQVTQLRQCVQSFRDGTGSISADIANSNASVAGSGEGCDGLNTSSSEIADSAQSQLDNVGTIMTTISSVLMSSITLLVTLLTSFMGLASGLGGLGSMGNLSNLSNLTSLTDLSSLTSAAGGISGLMSSFTAIASQLDIASGMSGNAQGLLGNLSGLVNL